MGFKVTATFEDFSLVAEGDGATYQVTFTNSFEGKSAAKELNAEQLAAVMALAINADTGMELERMLYEIAEPAVAGLDNDLRPMP